MQPQAKKTPAVQPQAKKPQHIATTSETKKPQQDSSARGGHFVPRRAAETASGKPLKAKQNHGKPWQDSSLKRKSKGFVGHACETWKPQQDSSPNLPKPSPVKLSNVAFWWPKETERWCNHKQRKPQQCNHKQRNPSIATTSETKKPQQDSSARGGHFVPRRAAETASGKPLKAKQNHGKPWQDSSLKRKSKGSVGHACETGKPQQDSSPNLPKPSPVKLSNVAFWRPKETERWCNHKQRKPQQCNQRQRNPSIATTSETKKPQQDSSPRGGQFVPWRAAETASSKPLKADATRTA